MQSELSQRSLTVRLAYLAYGVVCYAIFFATIVYAIGFVGNFWHTLGFTGPAFRSLDVAPEESALRAILIDLGLLALFALQHSGMARPAFKQRLKRFMPEALERSTYVLLASLCLDLLFSQWRPLGIAEVWHVAPGPLAFALIALSLVGWALVFAATFMINHFELFGLRQTWNAFRGRDEPEATFATPALYKAVRHPIYLGFLIAFWATPVMTLTHLLFAAGTTLYILGAIPLEERDLEARFGEQYREYRRRVRMLLPLRQSSRGERTSRTRVNRVAS